MKIRNLLPGFALAALLALGLTGTAHAGEQQPEDYTCNEGGHPPPASSNYDITIYAPNGSTTATCTLGSIQAASFGVLGFAHVNLGNVTATETIITIWDSVDIHTGDLSAGTNVLISENAMEVGNVTGGTAGPGGVQIYGNDGLTIGDIVNTGGNVLVGSFGSVSISSIDNTDGGVMIRAAGLIDAATVSNKNGDVRVFGNYEQTSGDPLVIGSGGIGYIHNNGDYGWGIYINSPTGISYDGTDLLQTHADSGTPGYVYLDGGSSGTVTLAGSIVVDKSDGAGSIAIFAPEIVTNGATLSASASPGSPAGNINLITAQITKTGALTINNNGDGASTAEIHLGITPADSWSVYPNQTNPDYFLETGPFQASSQPLSVTGSGLLTITANGDNHAVQIYGYPLNVTSAQITQHGTGDALYVQSTDYVNNVDGVLTLAGNVEFHENTTATGDTNVMDIRGTSLTALTGHILLDTSGLSGADGGAITVVADADDLTFGTTGNTLAANSSGSDSGGNAGTITIGSGNTLIDLGDGAGISASATGGDGNGGTVNITGSQIVLTGELNANGIGAGTGGHINLSIWGEEPMDLSAADIHIRAKGGDTGDGGSVSIDKVGSVTDGTADFDVADVVDVSGAQAGAPEESLRVSKNSSVSPAADPDEEKYVQIINNHKCKPYYQGPYSWPATYFNCTYNYNTPTAKDKVPVETALSSVFDVFRSSFQNANVLIYVFPTADQYAQFFNDYSNFSRSVGSITLAGRTTIYVTVWQQGSVGNPNYYRNYSSSELQEVAAHEFGHAVDITHNKWSRSTEYRNYIARDLYNLNRIYDSTVQQYIARNPCVKTKNSQNNDINEAPPFDGVYDYHDANATVPAKPVCVNGALNPAIATWPSGTTNVQVLQVLEAGLILTPTERQWDELHAQIFAYSAVGALGARPSMDGVLGKPGFFGCSKAWAATELSSNSKPAQAPVILSGSCAVAP